MSDDRWRRNGREDDPDEEFGGPLFPDDPSGAARRPADPSAGFETGEHRLRFGPDDTGPLPHWTDPPTGEIPRLDPRGTSAGPGNDDAEDDDVDVWSTFTTESPVWRDDEENLPTGVIEQVSPDYPPPDASGSFERDPSTGTMHPFDAASTGEVGRVGRDPSGAVPRDPSGGYGRTGDISRPIDADGSLFGDDDDDFRPSRGVGDPSGSVPRTTGSQRRVTGSNPRITGSNPRITGSQPRTGRSAERGLNLTGEVPLPPRREPGRITIGTDPSGMPRRQPEPGRRRQSPGRGGGRPIGPSRASAPPPPRSMSTATIAGVVMAAVFIAALILSTVVTVALVAIVLALAGWEYFGKVTEKGYRPAVFPGLAACLFIPIGAYAFGDQALTLGLMLVFVASSVSFIAAHGVESGPLPNMAVTTLGVVWIGILGAFAGLILRLSTGATAFGDTAFFGNGPNIGTDTLFFIALGIAANDIGALAVGSVAGKSALRAWVSPSKTIEGLIGGSAATLVTMFVAGQLAPDGNVWGQTKWWLLLAVVIIVLAPLGDLTESMFKRNLEIKDFGTIVQGHGGVLDRFDGFLFVLPGAYYLTLVLLATA